MAYFSHGFAVPLRRSLLSLSLLALLSGCSSDALDIDRSTHVSSIRHHRRPVPVYTSGGVQGENIADLSRANMAGIGHVPGPVAAPKPLPMIDSDEALAQGSGADGQPPQILGQLSSGPDGSASAGAQSVQIASAQPMTVTSDGVNIDAGLGVASAGNGADYGAPAGGTSLAREEADQIAETNASEPVVGGIGTDNLVQYPAAQPEPVAQPLAPARQPVARSNRPQTQEVAMLTRPIDPMANPALPPQPTEMPASERACRVALQRMGVKFQDVTPIYNGPTCGIPYPVKVYGFASNIAMKPAVTLNCQVTLAFSQWVKNELNPSARYRYWSGVRTIIPLGGYSCRRMNSSARNPWSEHARGNAIDVGKFVLNSGKEIDVRKPGFFSFRERGLLNAVRSDSCKYFHTVLGPGSDPHHKDHFHFDLRTRKSGYRHCD